MIPRRSTLPSWWRGAAPGAMKRKRRYKTTKPTTDSTFRIRGWE
jgi:hypothetical protein